jgi:hypothetical protein
MLIMQNFFAQIQAADTLWIVGAIILGFLAFKVAAKLLKFVLLAVVVVLFVGFLMSTGVIPSIF